MTLFLRHLVARVGVVAIGVAGLLVACAPEAPRPDPSATGGSPIVATADGRPITLADVDRFVGRAGAETSADVDLRTRYADLARRVALERLLLDRARAEGVDRLPEIVAMARELKRTAYTDHWLAARSPPGPITEEALRAHFEATKQRFERPERRRVDHIFLRYDPEDDPRAVRERLDAIRATIVDGLPFEQVAAEVSESESRHHGGNLGFVERGVFPPDFDRIVFALDVGVPSEVVSTGDGAHLFVVTNVLEARPAAIDALRPLLLRDLRLLRRLERLRALVAEVPDPVDALRVDDETALGLLERGRPDLTVLQVGDVELTVGRFRERIAELGRALGDLADDEQAVRWLEEVELREVLYQHMLTRERDGETFDVPLDAVQVTVERALVDGQARRMMRERLTGDRARLERHYADHAGRFVTPLGLDFERLTLPAAAVDPSVMARLERARDDLDQQRGSLASLAGELDGWVRRTGPLSIDALRRTEPAAVPLVTPLRVGEHSPPYRTHDGVAMVRLIERHEPETQPFDAVRDAVIEDVLTRDAVALFRELGDDLLAEADFTLDEATLDRLASP